MLYVMNERNATFGNYWGGGGPGPTGPNSQDRREGGVEGVKGPGPGTRGGP